MIFDWEKYLTYHGKSKDVCKNVIERFDKPAYEDNAGIQLWIKASKQCLKELHSGQT